MNRHLRNSACLALLGTVVAALGGCRPEPTSGFERYIPPAETARGHLSHALEGWRQGLAPGESGSTRPEVHIVDQTRRVDQKLVRYEILGEVPAENARAFAVRVTYDGVDEPEILRFFAIGVDPMWIFRREDYENIWNHERMAPADRTSGPPAPKP